MLNKGYGFVVLSLTWANDNLDSHVCSGKTHKKFCNFVTFISVNDKFKYAILFANFLIGYFALYYRKSGWRTIFYGLANFNFGAFCILNWSLDVLDLSMSYPF